MRATSKISESGQGGFTLLEVMIALAIISVSLIVLLQSQSSNVARVYHSGTLTKAVILAQKILSDMDLGGKIVLGTWEGEEDLDAVTFSWNKLVEPSIVKDIVKVTVRVSWGEEGKNIPLVIETYRTL